MQIRNCVDFQIQWGRLNLKTLKYKEFHWSKFLGIYCCPTWLFHDSVERENLFPKNLVAKHGLRFIPSIYFFSFLCIEFVFHLLNLHLNIYYSCSFGIFIVFYNTHLAISLLGYQVNCHWIPSWTKKRVNNCLLK